MTRLKFITYLGVFVVLIACVGCGNSSNEEEIPSPYQGVDEELIPYFKRFEEEAANHGLNLDLTELGVTGSLERIVDHRVAGRCDFGSRHVTINSNTWSTSIDLKLEEIIFHELGHCALRRGHREDQSVNGACLSMMRSGRGGCIFLYNEITRAKYLEELFDPEFR